MLNGLIIWTILAFKVCLFLSLSDNKDSFSAIREETKLSKNEFVLVTFYNQKDCMKCYITQSAVVNCLKKSKVQALKFLYYVKCNRKAELILFRKQLETSDFLMMDKGKTKLNLNLNIESIMALLDSKSKVINEFSHQELMNIDSCCKIMINNIGNNN